MKQEIEVLEVAAPGESPTSEIWLGSLARMPPAVMNSAGRCFVVALEGGALLGGQPGQRGARRVAMWVVGGGEEEEEPPAI